MFWKLRYCDWTNETGLVGYLRAGWEPFAVTDSPDGPPTVWLRKRVDDPADANLVSI